MKRIIFTVTNDLNYDQRMIRICTSLSRYGYDILLIGTKFKGSLPLVKKNYQQIRFPMLFSGGFGFYAEYNTRLFFYLLFSKCDLLCCIDLDTIIPVWLVSMFRGKKRVYDAHEYFSQMKEVVTRPAVYRIWHGIEKFMIPRYKNGYTVSNSIVAEFKKRYEVNYELIRNLPLLSARMNRIPMKEKMIIYQGAVNAARGLESLIPAMKQVNAKLFIYGDGNFMEATKKLIRLNNLEEKVLLKGKVLPEELESSTAVAHIGINLVEHSGLNQYYSLANKFFDYIHHGIPQVTMNFPEYKKINDEFEVAILIDNTDISVIAGALNNLLNDAELYKRLQQNCIIARNELNWQAEEKKLLDFYDRILN